MLVVRGWVEQQRPVLLVSYKGGEETKAADNSIRANRTGLWD